MLAPASVYLVIIALFWQGDMVPTTLKELTIMLY